MATLSDIVTKDSVDRSVTLRIIDATDGTPETGVTFETAGIDLWYRREGGLKVSITEVALALLTTAHADGGFLHISDGEYRFDLPDAAFATGANYVEVGGTVTGMVVIGGRVRLTDLDFEAAAALASVLGTPIDADIATDIANVDAKVGQITSTGSASNVGAESFALTTGSQVNTYTSTHALDNVKHELTDDAGTFVGVYQFDIKANAVPTGLEITGVFNGNNDTWAIEANKGTNSTPVWIQAGEVAGTNNAGRVVHPFKMLDDWVVTDLVGKVQIRVNGTGLTSSSFDADQIIVSKAVPANFNAYPDGRIWIDTGASNTNTEPDVDGTARNPVSTIAAAVTLSGSTGLTDFHLVNGSSVALTANSDNYSFFGDNWTISTTGTQSFAGTYIQGAHVSGVSTAASGKTHLEGCAVHTFSVQSGHFDFCSFAETVTHTLAGNYNYHDCYSNVAGAGSPTFAKTAGQAITAQWRRWSGSITFSGLEVGDTITIGDNVGTIDLGSPAGAVAVEVRGIYKSLVNVGSAVVNLDGAIKGVDVASILVDTTEIGVAGVGLTDLGGMSTAMKAEVNTEIDTALIDAGLVLQVTTIATLASQTSFTLTEGSPDNDPYINQIAVITDQSTGTQKAVMSISDYVGSSKTITLAKNPGIFTMAVGDTIAILASDTIANWNAVNTGMSFNITNSTGKQLRSTAAIIIREGASQGPGTGNNQIQLDAGASATDGAYDPAMVYIVGGTGTGQTRLILQYDGTTKIATVDRNWKVNPDAASEYVISAHPGREHVNEGLARGGTAFTVTLNALASSDDGSYDGQTVFVRSGTGEDQARLVVAYDGTTKIATIDLAWDVTPDTTSGYVMLPTAIKSESIQVRGSVDDASATVTTFKTTLTAVDCFYDDSLIKFTSGALIGQVRPILTYTQLNGQIVVSEDLTSAPADTVSFVILSAHVHPIEQIADAVLTRSVSNVEATAGSDTLCELILGTFHTSAISAGTWTIKRIDNSTTFSTVTITTSGSAELITSTS